MLRFIDDILLKITDKVPEKWSGPTMIISFLVSLNIADYLVPDAKTYGIIGAVFLVFWMFLGMRLAEAYKRRK